MTCAAPLPRVSPSTIADCFKFRNKLGLDIALEALRLARERRKATTRAILHYARRLRVDRVVQPYLQM
jgi:hypothetical protein